MTQRIRHVSRTRDEQLLAQVAARAKGTPAAVLARKYGVNSGILITATNKVFEADMAESGEDAAKVREAYWGRL